MFLSKFINMARDFVMQGDVGDLSKTEEIKESPKTDASKNAKIIRNQANHPAGEGASEPFLASTRLGTNVRERNAYGTSPNLLGNNLKNSHVLAFQENAIEKDNKHSESKPLIAEADFISIPKTDENELVKSDKQNELKISTDTELAQSSSENFISLPSVSTLSHGKNELSTTNYELLYSIPKEPEVDPVSSAYNLPLAPLTLESDSSDAFNTGHSAELKQEMVVDIPEDKVSKATLCSIPKDKYSNLSPSERTSVSSISKQHCKTINNTKSKGFVYSERNAIPTETMDKKFGELVKLTMDKNSISESSGSNKDFNINSSKELKQEMAEEFQEGNVSEKMMSYIPKTKSKNEFSEKKPRFTSNSKLDLNQYNNFKLKDMAYSAHGNIPTEPLGRKPAVVKQVNAREKQCNKKFILTQKETIPPISPGLFDIDTSLIFDPKEIINQESKEVCDFVYKTFPPETLSRKFVEATMSKTKEKHRNKKSIYTQTETMPQFTGRSLNSNRVPISNIFHTLESSVTLKAPHFFENANRKHTISEDIVYGELLVFGCNGSPPPHLIGKMQSKFILRKRIKPNGVRESFTYVTPKSINRRRDSLTVSYSIPNGSSVVVEYMTDKNTDMFQIGRSDDPPVDFKVLDVNTDPQSRKGVSRFACRLVVQRNGRHEARVYAAAFDSSGDIFLGKDAYTISRKGKMDGFTTNGVYIMHPDSEQLKWLEVSVCGNIYPLRSKQTSPSKRHRLLSESNVLRDGTLIDLCGVTLLWRTPSGLRNTPTERWLQKLQSLLQTVTPDCHLPSPEKICNSSRKRPFVFLCCGHVLRLSEQLDDNLKGWSCPLCRSIGPISRLKIGIEPGFYLDQSFPSHCFRPCGHVTNLKTAQFWSNVKVPEHRSIEDGFCPFCSAKLNSINKYIKLLLP